MRTGTVAVHSVKLFAKSDFSDIGLIGLGNTARATYRERKA
jgi:ornithine cyclodeaminase/alanine dehydrogenase